MKRNNQEGSGKRDRPDLTASVPSLLTPERLSTDVFDGEVPPKTLEAWRWKGTGPPYVRVGKRVFYLPEDVSRWLERQRRGGCEEQPAA